MESSVTIPLAYYEELKDDSKELKLLQANSTYSTVWRLGCDKNIEVLNKDETIKALNEKLKQLNSDRGKSETFYTNEIKKLKKLNQVLTDWILK